MCEIRARVCFACSFVLVIDMFCAICRFDCSDKVALRVDSPSSRVAADETAPIDMIWLDCVHGHHWIEGLGHPKTCW